LTVKDELEIVLFEEQKDCISCSGGLGWKCNSCKRTIRKRKIITMTFSLNGEGAILLVKGRCFIKGYLKPCRSVGNICVTLVHWYHPKSNN
jgi:hypothetical protein